MLKRLKQLRQRELQKKPKLKDWQKRLKPKRPDSRLKKNCRSKKKLRRH